MIGFKKTSKPPDLRSPIRDPGRRRSTTHELKLGDEDLGEEKVRRRSSSPGTKLKDNGERPPLSEKKIALIARLGESERIETKLRLAESQIQQLKSVLA